MSLLDVLRSAVAIADSVTKDIQATVLYERSIPSVDGMGTPNYTDGVELKAIVDWKQKHLRTAQGELTVSRASITLLDIDELVAATEGEGVSDNDRFTLPDGTTGPIIDMSGFIDAETGHPLATEVFIG